MIIPSKQEIEEALRYDLDKQEFKLVKDLYIYIMGIHIVLPKGLYTDGASFPFFVQWFVKGTDKDIMIWAILHDYIYRTQFTLRVIADAIFMWGISKTKSKVLARLSYVGLRAFGFIAWYNNKRKGLQKFPEVKNKLKKYICDL